MVEYFWDSYAVIELIDGNRNYARFSQEIVHITLFNLAEIYWSAIHEYDEKSANEIYEKYKDCLVEVDDDTLKEAIKFRKQNKKKNLSYTDCIGYIYALRNDMNFLTGDKEFENFDNVEFVK